MSKVPGKRAQKYKWLIFPPGWVMARPFVISPGFGADLLRTEEGISHV